jgi:hypothetical protein
MATSSCWLLQADNRFGPRIDADCRAFDFTLLFEDIFFNCLPATIFLLFSPIRLRGLRYESVKVSSYKLASYKLVGFIPYIFPCGGLFEAVPSCCAVFPSGSFRSISSPNIGPSYPGFLASSHTQYFSDFRSAIRLLYGGPAICETLESSHPLFFSVHHLQTATVALTMVDPIR